MPCHSPTCHFFGARAVPPGAYFQTPRCCSVKWPRPRGLLIKYIALCSSTCHSRMPAGLDLIEPSPGFNLARVGSMWNRDCPLAGSTRFRFHMPRPRRVHGTMGTADFFIEPRKALVRVWADVAQACSGSGLLLVWVGCEFT